MGRHRLLGCLAGLAGVAAVTAGLSALSSTVEVLSLAVCYQLAVLVVSGVFGSGAGLVTSVASVLAFNWFFLPPVHTLAIADTRNWLSLGVFAATAVITGQLAAGFRRQRQEAEARRRDADLLTELARSALADIGSGSHVDAVAAAAARALGVQRCAIVLTDERTGGTVRLSASRGGFAIPLVADSRPLGLLEVGPPLDGQEPRWTRPGFAAAVGGLVVLAVDRGRLLAQTLETESLRRSDELKTALLRTVSHELRTPVTALRTAGEALASSPGPPDERALVAVIQSESERLERLIGNLLDLSRLEAGALGPQVDWCDPVELAAGAIEAAATLLDGRPVAARFADDLPLVRADAVFCERILVNLLHNAARHGAGPISLEVLIAGDRLELAVVDGGRGPDAALRSRLFAPFVSGRGSGGTGVGLALSRGLARAQGGTLRLDGDAAGTRFVLALPLAPVPEVLEG
ncbi:MAG: two-component system, OmpR family, sensor histidine kinase KdpD [Miltoncostaeaceae bacterium]|jgi:two-component system sensor histidine kinase KdpD|nr:two-component system, OmpR family, sensor histidine kinase KdpD [Miltoncostaeaceae bacterium]